MTKFAGYLSEHHYNRANMNGESMIVGAVTSRARKNRENSYKIGEVPERDLIIGKACLGLAECLLYAKNSVGAPLAEMEAVANEAIEHLQSSELSGNPFIAMAALPKFFIAISLFPIPFLYAIIHLDISDGILTMDLHQFQAFSPFFSNLG